MRPTSSYLIRRAAPFLALAFAGCGGGRDNLPREPIAGTFAVEGEPLASGAIRFQSDNAETPAVGGLISDGKFAIPRAEGPVPGTYKVQVTENTTPPVRDLNNFQLRTKRTGPSKLTPFYRKGMNLTAEVKAGQENRYGFNLRLDDSKGKSAARPGDPRQ